MLHQRIIVVFKVMLAVLLGSLVGFTHAAAIVDSLKTISIKDYTVDEREYKREYDRYRSTIMVKYAGKITDQSTLSEFWETAVQGTSPAQNLKDTVLYALKRLKVQEKLLNKYGLWSYSDYGQFLRDMELTNESRKKAVAEGKVIYGPIVYSERAFYDYKFSNAVIHLKRVIDGKEIICSEKDLSDYFKEKVMPVRKYQETDFDNMKSKVKEWLIEDRYKLLIDSLSK